MQTTVLSPGQVGQSMTVSRGCTNGWWVLCMAARHLVSQLQDRHVATAYHAMLNYPSMAIRSCHLGVQAQVVMSCCVH